MTAISSSRFSWADETPARSKLGIATTCYMTVAKPKDTLDFLEHCHALGAAGIQSVLNGDMHEIRTRAEKYGMYVEAMVPMPRDGSNTEALEKALADARTAGVTCARTQSSGGRRYETHTTLADYKAWMERSNAALAAAVPVLEKYKIPAGIENHKDRTADELAALLKKHSSEYLGACLDCGNNIALLDAPMYAIETLAPYAVTTHFKDMAVAPDDDGFLLSEVLLGQGIMDLPRVISTIKGARPQIHLVLEMITRDPLRVPCLTDQYWAGFPDRNGVYLARTLKLVQQHSDPAKPLPRISQLDHAAQLQVENENVKQCLAYARGLSI
jgi:sugar phosphate isomerase/epimerase